MAAQLSSKARECDTFQSTLASEQRRVDELLQVIACVESGVLLDLLPLHGR